jgi:RNA polymerase sigma-70 factor, ECF subfamily
MYACIQELLLYLMTVHKQYTSMDDAWLAQQARSDRDAFAELYRRHVLSVFRYHRAHTDNDRDAEDLTSQTFVAALEGIRSFRGTGPCIAWLMGIATRLRARFFRGRRPEVPLETALHLPTPTLPTDKAAARRIQMEQVIDALRTISPDRAEALILCFISELSTAEAAFVLGKRESAIRMLISRGLQDLRTRTSLALEVDYE